MKSLPRLFVLGIFVLLAARAESKTPLTPADANGIWQVEVDTLRGAGTPVIVLAQKGQKLTGRYVGILGEAPLSGTLRGQEIRFSFEVRRDGKPMRVNYRGRLEGDQIRGLVQVGKDTSGLFRGRKQVE